MSVTGWIFVWLIKMTTHYGNMKVFSRHGVHEVTGAMIAKLSTEYKAIQIPPWIAEGLPKFYL